MYEPKLSKDDPEFQTLTVIEFNHECPHCKETNFNSISTYIRQDILGFKCIHCERYFLIAYYAFSPEEAEIQGIEPFDYDVYKCVARPAKVEKSFGVFELDEDEEDEEKDGGDDAA